MPESRARRVTTTELASVPLDVAIAGVGLARRSYPGGCARQSIAVACGLRHAVGTHARTHVAIAQVVGSRADQQFCTRSPVDVSRPGAGQPADADVCVPGAPKRGRAPMPTTAAERGTRGQIDPAKLFTHGMSDCQYSVLRRRIFTCAVEHFDHTFH